MTYQRAKGRYKREAYTAVDEEGNKFIKTSIGSIGVKSADECCER
jgi:hypothetical protein